MLNFSLLAVVGQSVSGYLAKVCVHSEHTLPYSQLLPVIGVGRLICVLSRCSSDVRIKYPFTPSWIAWQRC